MDAIPVVPSQGSVGASGDLAPYPFIFTTYRIGKDPINEKDSHYSTKLLCRSVLSL